MINNKATYQIEMATDGTHRVTVTIEDPSGAKAAIAAARGIYSALLREDDLEEVAEQPAAIDETNPPQCELHNVPMTLVQGSKGPFWSCHKKNDDGSWCSYKAA
jgi:hypothetical protein